MKSGSPRYLEAEAGCTLIATEAFGGVRGSQPDDLVVETPCKKIRESYVLVLVIVFQDSIRGWSWNRREGPCLAVLSCAVLLSE